MRAVARGLEALAIGLALLALAILALGSVSVGALRLTRPEDLVVAVAAVLGARALVAPFALPRLRPDTVVLGGVALYIALMSFIVITRHFALRTHALDLGQYLQVIWSIATGRGARSTMPPLHFWGEHLSPVFYLLAPLMWLAPGAPSLLVAQTVALAGGGFAVYGIAVRRLGERRVAAGFALLYLANPTLHGINVRDIHPAAFVIPLLLGAALAFDAGRAGWGAIALVLTLACREDAAVVVVGFGVWLAVARGRTALGTGVAVGAVAVLFIELSWVMPYFRGGSYPHLQRYAHLGGSLGPIIATVIVRPWRWLGVAISARKALYLAALLAPLGFLPLLAPRALVAALPGLAMNLLSLDPVLFHHRSQYQAFVLPFLVLAAVDGYRNLQRGRGDGRLANRRLGALLLGTAFVASVALGARTVNDLGVAKWRLGAEQRDAHALMRTLPPRAVVSANERLVPHLATRPEIFVYPAGLERSEYVLVHETELARTPAAGHREIDRRGRWVLLERQGGR